MSGSVQKVSSVRIRSPQVQDYRACILGPDGHIHDRVDMLATDDGEAIKLANQLVDGHDVELWQLGRKIRRFKHAPKLAGGCP
jgi:hypothetical protein